MSLPVLHQQGALPALDIWPPSVQDKFVISCTRQTLAPEVGQPKQKVRVEPLGVFMCFPADSILRGGKRGRWAPNTGSGIRCPGLLQPV